MHYFAQDGNFGDANDIVIAHTDTWTTEDWDKVIDAPDRDRKSVAENIIRQKNNVRLLGL